MATFQRSDVAWAIWRRMKFLVCVSMTSSCSVNSGTICLQKLPSNCDLSFGISAIAHKAGFSWCEVWVIHLWGPLSHCYENKRKIAIQFKLLRKWRCGHSKSSLRSIKNSKSSLECPTNNALVAAFDEKVVQLHGIVEIVFGWQEQDYQFLQANQPEMSWLNSWHNTWPTVL